MIQLFNRIKVFLDEQKVEYIVKTHLPTSTSEDSARERGEPLKIGAKALLVKDNTHFVLVIVPADRRLDTGKLKKILHSQNLRFATAEELKQLTGCEKGAVPPFGHLLGMGVEMIVDEALFGEEYLAFNAGSLEVSIKMKTADYKRIIQPKTGIFSVPG
ncbi:TPA: YbaK/prolyl-tRNA synthetase associated domain-containing protein [Candidatus Woesearchaeota archaeon]|nr:YbaK/prolyl-tRNA synthetase associated domain-containing protein [Candidatus Woesearchaeota archaeon]HIG93453.1 YbaK/prolyl-tRNA synthetase associated domain-containing protein [Candidatus Woesearchaeota archaeon]HIH12321.1 YbaK/prolyl-tRNA synthetase associated domain-containing protein [Candidatus Woesearchaeota archaeon]